MSDWRSRTKWHERGVQVIPEDLPPPFDEEAWRFRFDEFGIADTFYRSTATGEWRRYSPSAMQRCRIPGAHEGECEWDDR